MECRDELGFRLELDEPPQRIVSLVPSLTETLFALGLERRIVAVTKRYDISTRRLSETICERVDEDVFARFDARFHRRTGDLRSA